MQAAGRCGSATSYKPFLHDVTKGGPERHRTIKPKTSRPRPKVLTAQHAPLLTILESDPPPNAPYLRERRAVPRPGHAFRHGGRSSATEASASPAWSSSTRRTDITRPSLPKDGFLFLDREKSWPRLRRPRP